MLQNIAKILRKILEKVCKEALENIEEAAETVSKRRRSCAVKIPVFKHQEVEKYIKAEES